MEKYFKYKLNHRAMGMLLTFCAGYINVLGIRLVFGEAISFMSGKGAFMGIYLFSGDYTQFIFFVLLVSAFVMGAYIGAWITSSLGFKHSLYTVSTLLYMIGFVLMYFGAEQGSDLELEWFGEIVVAGMTFTSGMLNASTSLTPIGRTTHLTGPATDMGISVYRKDFNQFFRLLMMWVSFFVGAYICSYILHLYHNSGLSLSFVVLLPSTLIILASHLYQE